jgi:hypothetical protein
MISISRSSSIETFCIRSERQQTGLREMDGGRSARKLRHFKAGRSDRREHDLRRHSVELGPISTPSWRAVRRERETVAGILFIDRNNVKGMPRPGMRRRKPILQD